MITLQIAMKVFFFFFCRTIRQTCSYFLDIKLVLLSIAGSLTGQATRSLFTPLKDQQACLLHLRMPLFSSWALQSSCWGPLSICSTSLLPPRCCQLPAARRRQNWCHLHLQLAMESLRISALRFNLEARKRLNVKQQQPQKVAIEITFMSFLLLGTAGHI